MKLISLQLALFFKDATQRPDIDFSDLPREFPSFDAIPTTLPIPQLPVEVPVVMQRSSDGRLHCNIARSRIDLITQRVDEKSNEEILQDFNKIVEQFLKYVLARKNINRFGLICNYFYPTPNPVNAICNKYVKNTIGVIDDLSIRFNKQSFDQSIIINDAVTLNPGSVAFGAEPEKDGIVIQRDINSQPDQNMVITLEVLRAISHSKSKLITESAVMELVR